MAFSQKNRGWSQVTVELRLVTKEPWLATNEPRLVAKVYGGSRHAI
jgi:hypothetical protein